ncbi:MAG TPA: hypothetical protein VFC02_22945 [Anaerolineales bacterium]|nr:hypothetical protein [Anaerolineales bacterium]
MNHETAESLPSLACPLIANPAEDVENEKTDLITRLRLPPFPAIDFNKWDGFTFPHLNWVGLKLDAALTPDLQAGKDNLPLLLLIHHEACHQLLGLTPFSAIKNYEVAKLYSIIEETFNKTKEQISVPLRYNLSQNEIEKQWRIVVQYKRASQLIEEVYAVQSSLLIAHEIGIIKDDQLRRLIRKYKRAYGRSIDGFAMTYNAYDFVVGEIGKVAATSMVCSVLTTRNPNIAFNELLNYMCTIDQATPKGYIWRPHLKGRIEDLATSSFDEAYAYFVYCLSRIDPDDSRYLRKDVENYRKMIIKKQSTLSKSTKDDILKILLGSSRDTLFSDYSNYIHAFYKAGYAHLTELYEKFIYNEVTMKEAMVEVADENFTIFLESIIQQLTQGVGLGCPFWGWKESVPCCGGRNREFLEKVWKCTKPEEPCTWSAYAGGGRLWMPIGCLDENESSC